LVDLGKQVPPHLEQQIGYCEAVSKALEKHENDLKLNRAFKLFNIDSVNFQTREKGELENDTKVLRGLAKSIFDAVSTQAFQIGYLMAVLTAVERITPIGTSYDQRAKNAQFIAALYLRGFNTLFANASTKHRGLAGYVTESRAKAFDSSSDGFRGLLQAGNVRELNEKQWEFFRFVVLEVVHSKRAFEAVNEVLVAPEWADQVVAYRKALPDLLKELELLRTKYIEAAVRASQHTQEFSRQCLQAEAEAKASGNSDTEAKEVVERMIIAKRQQVEQVCKKHLEASLGRVEKSKDLLKRFSAEGPETVANNLAVSKGDADFVSDSLIADEVLHDASPDGS